MAARFVEQPRLEEQPNTATAASRFGEMKSWEASQHAVVGFTRLATGAVGGISFLCADLVRLESVTAPAILTAAQQATQDKSNADIVKKNVEGFRKTFAVIDWTKKPMTNVVLSIILLVFVLTTLFVASVTGPGD